MPYRSLLALVLTALGVSVLAQSPEGSPKQEPSADKSSNNPSLERMKKDLFLLASPEFEGRGPGTKGLDLAADYIAEQFKSAGLEPGGKEGYFQPFSISGSPALGKINTLAFEGPDAMAKAVEGKTFQVMGLSGKGKVSAPLVFAGYGISSKEHKYDDYAGLDVAGKIVVVLRHAPRWNDKESPFGKDRDALASLERKVATAESHKAAALVLVNDSTELPKDEIPPFSYLARASSSRIPAVHVKRSLIDPILKSGLGSSLEDLEKGIDENLKPRSGAVKGWTGQVETSVARTNVAVKNVIGVVPGKGPLAKEMIVIGAHYDHLGYGGPGSLARDVKGKAIHFGADDNASGTTAMIELARRFASQKNREGRTLVFMAFSAEERGLLGSLHYVKSPIFPLSDTAAMLNLDMVGKLRPDPKTKLDKLHVQGVGTAKGFVEMIDKLAEGSFTLSKGAGGSGPSDHNSFNAKRIPVLFFYTGMHPDYHKPSDTAEKINLEGIAKVVDLVEKVATELGGEPERRAYVEVKGAAVAGGPKGPRLGIVPDYESDDKGLLVNDVSAGGAAEKAGIKAGDLIVEIGGRNVSNVQTYMAAMSQQKAGQAVEIVVVRDSKRLTLMAMPQ